MNRDEQLDPREHSDTEAYIEQDDRGVITEWNDHAARLYGWPNADAIGMRSHMLVPPRNRVTNDRATAQAFASAGVVAGRRQLTALHQDGHEFHVEVVFRVIGAGAARRLACSVRKLSEPRRGEEAFRGDAERFRAILDQIHDACSVVDLRGTYLFVNDAYCRMRGYQRHQVLGHRFRDIAPREHVGPFNEIYVDVYRTGTPRAFEFELPGPDGQPRYYEQSVSLERDQRGRPVGFLAIVRDVTERRRAELNAARAKEAAEAADRAKSEFLANMSHEIRTPMNGIIGMTELALNTELTPYQAECLAAVKASADSLLTVLNDILDFSKIESRKLELEAGPFSLHDLLSETLKPLAVRAEATGLELILEVAPEVPDGLIGDPVRVRQVITNLVGNAIKFTEQGSVMVAVRQDARGEGCTMLHFSVSDTGIGIPREKQGAIFEPFKQADGSTTRRFGGTGLGLTISATLVQLMGGRIWVDSVPGDGSTFHFTAAFDVGPAPSLAVPDESQLRGVRVLVVDDNATNRRIFEEQLRAWQMDVTVVDGGRAALAAMKDAARAGRRYALVLLDANMPELDGFEVAQHIAAHSELADATIMLLTSSGQYGDAARCRERGIAAYLTKPVKTRELLTRVCRVIVGGASAPGPAPAPRPAPARAPQPLRVLLAEDNAVNQRVATGLLTNRGHTVTVAANGLEALERLAEGRFDVVLMDIQMPKMGGFDATARIREQEAGTDRHTRIVAMTAHAMNGDRERCLAAGMDGYIAKPLDGRTLFTLIEGDLQPQPIADAVDRRALLERLGGDEELLADVVELFLEDCPQRVESLKAAIGARDAAAIRAEAHALKGAAANLSLEGLAEAARMLERLGEEQRLAAAEGAWKQLSVAAAEALDALRALSSRA